ncbi:MAG: branched-chain amino acid ABC transporter permease [Proteobacteria bacterium]|nr:branched-chain amino acid ABC transporter permease [Pseudomonadota bacterium]
MIIALIALGYSLVYGIIELINFAHGDLVMLGGFFSLTLIGLLGLNNPDISNTTFVLSFIFVFVATTLFCGFLNYLIDRYAYAPIRNSSRLPQLVTAIGVSFVLMNIGLLWGGLPMDVFNFGNAAAAQKDFPSIISNQNLISSENVQFSLKDLTVYLITIPLMFALSYFVKNTKMGTAMRAVAQNPTAAELMGIDVNKIISLTFIIGGMLGGVASIVFSIYNNTIYFQMGYRIGMDGFTAAVLGGIGNLPGAVLGGILIGLLRAFCDQYIATKWTNSFVFLILIVVLVFRPNGLLGAKVRDKV